MRTTTKRGIGRGAAVNGNGRAVLPPGALSPITVYRQPDPPRRSRWALVRTAFLWLFVFLLMCAGALGGGAYLWFHESVAAVVATTPDVKVAAKQLDIPLPGQPATALVSATTSGRARAGTRRAPTRSCSSAPTRTQTRSRCSRSRATCSSTSTAPGKPSYPGQINEAYADCGTKGTLETVRAYTGLPINYLITVNFRGFRQLVDKFGGIWMDVDRRYFNDRGGPGGYATINLQPGLPAARPASRRSTSSATGTPTTTSSGIARQQLFVQAPSSIRSSRSSRPRGSRR